MKTIQIVHFLNKRLLLHALFWIVVVFLVGIPYWFSFDGQLWLEFLLQILVYVFLIYSVLYLVYKPFLPSGKWYIFIPLYLFFVLLSAHVYSYFYLLLFPEKTGQVGFLNFVPFYFMFSVLAVLLKFSKEIYLKAYREGEEKAGLIQQRLDFLKNQIQPHFLFNTLSNFYGLSLEKSDKLPDLMLKLSNIMRHITYHISDEFVNLEQEATYLKDYMALEQIRFEEGLKAELRMEIPAGSAYKIAPMLLAGLLENAFKHSKGIAAENTVIEGVLRIEDEYIVFDLKNSLLPSAYAGNKKDSGAGLENIKERLRIIYPGEHEFQYGQDGEFYVVSLKVKAKS